VSAESVFFTQLKKRRREEEEGRRGGGLKEVFKELELQVEVNLN